MRRKNPLRKSSKTAWLEKMDMKELELTLKADLKTLEMKMKGELRLIK